MIQPGGESAASGLWIQRRTAHLRAPPEAMGVAVRAPAPRPRQERSLFASGRQRSVDRSGRRICRVAARGSGTTHAAPAGAAGSDRGRSSSPCTTPRQERSLFASGRQRSVDRSGRRICRERPVDPTTHGAPAASAAGSDAAELGAAGETGTSAAGTGRRVAELEAGAVDDQVARTRATPGVDEGLHARHGARIGTRTVGDQEELARVHRVEETADAVGTMLVRTEAHQPETLERRTVHRPARMHPAPDAQLEMETRRVRRLVQLGILRPLDRRQPTTEITRSTDPTLRPVVARRRDRRGGRPRGCGRPRIASRPRGRSAPAGGRRTDAPRCRRSGRRRRRIRTTRRDVPRRTTR